MSNISAPTRAGRAFFLAFAVFFLFWAAWGQGIPAQGMRWTVAAVGFSLALCGLSLGTAWAQSNAWLALALAGQACSLQLLSVGSLSHLQVFKTWDRLLKFPDYFFLGALVVQAVLVLRGSARFWPATRKFCSAFLSAPRVLVFLGLFIFAASIVEPVTVTTLLVEKTGMIHRTLSQLAKTGLGVTILSLGAVNLLLAVASIPVGVWDKAAAWWRGLDRSRLPWFCALWVSLVSVLLAYFVLDRVPHIPDEVAYHFHAKYFAAGKLYLPLPPEPDAFRCSLVLMENGKWFSAQLPGWPAVLALGFWAGVPWLVNPLLGGLGILLAHLFVRRLYDRDVADATVLLLSFSPWFLFMSASFMGHPGSLVFSLLCLLAVHRVREGGRWYWGVVAGAALGALADTRPLEALALSIPAGVWWLLAGFRRLRLIPLAAATLACVAVFGLMLGYNQAVVGDPWTIPFQRVMEQNSYPGANRVGFGRDVGNFGWTHMDPLEGHGLLDVLVNTNQNLYIANFDLFAWAGGSLTLVLLLLVWGSWRRDALMWGVVLSVWAGMSCYWFSGGHDYGARYWYQMIVPLAVLTVRGAQEFAARTDSAPSSLVAPGGQRVWAWVVVASLVGFLNVMPWRAIDKYKNYRRVRGDVQKLEELYNFGHSLVFVRGETTLSPWISSVYAAAFALNPPTVDRDAPGPIYVRDLGPESRDRLRYHYSDRTAWVLADSVLTGGAFEVLEGPLPPLDPSPLPRSQ